VSLRLVQAGRDEPRVVAFFFLTGPDVDQKLRDALGPTCAIVADVESHGTETMTGLLAWARSHAVIQDVAGYALCGWSNGVQHVRDLMHAGADPVAVVAADGTHASMPPADWQIQIWHDYAEKARARTKMLAASCTQMSYVERIPVGKPGRAMSTRHVLEKATGLELLPSTEAHDGDLHLISSPSPTEPTLEAAAAHRNQVNEVMPRMVRDYLAPWLKGWLKPQRPSQTPPLPNTHVTNEALTPLGERCVLWCENEFACAVREDPPGSNTSPRIRDYLAPCMRNGKLLGLRAAAWCAAAQCCAMRECVAPGEAEPHPYRCSGIELETDAQKLGTWRGPKYTPRRGDIAVLMRTNSDPSKGSWERHVVRVRSVDGDTMTTIAGNEGNGWAVSAMRLDDARILCFIEYPQ
jgi:hypothetical protein